MSSLKDKMYNHEVTPPANAWEKIAASLDESETENKFPSALYNLQVNPPAGVWEKISDTIDQSKNQPAFPAKLYNLEIDPPAGTWDKIDSSLNTSAEKVVPVRRLNPFVRYAAAAVLIGAVAFGIIRMSINNSKENTTAVSAINKQDSSVPSKNLPGDIKQAQPVITFTDSEEPAKNQATIAKSDRVLRKATRKQNTAVFASGIDNEVMVDPSLSQSIYAYADHIPDISERYVMMMTPDGNIIRMSKKWSDLLCCVSGEEQDPGCKNQLKKWQEKLATSSLANFMDILGLVRSLDESNGL